MNTAPDLSQDFTFGPLYGKARRKKFLVLDIESKDGESRTKAGFTRPFLVGVYDGEHFHAFYDKQTGEPWDKRFYMPGGCLDRALRFILRKKYRGWHIYAHNGGRFDFLFQLPWLMHVGKPEGFQFTVIPVASAIQVLDVWRGNARKYGAWRFLDSYRLIPLALDKAAKTFGLKGKVEHNLDLDESDPRWIDYLRGDCVELYRVVERFHHVIEENLGSEVGITAPSTAVKLLRRQFMADEYPRTVASHDFVREGYYGGRVEVFRERGEGLYYYDINSSYPTSMLKPMPAGVGGYWSKGEPPTRYTRGRHGSGTVGFVRARVLVPTSLHIPPLPIRIGDELKSEGVQPGKLLFPTGELEGVWEFEELQTALKVGVKILKWFDSWWFEAVPLFTEFVRRLYAYRDKSRDDYDDGMAAIAKLLLNSTYGKFGMRHERVTLYLWDDPELPDNATPAAPSPDCPIWIAKEDVDADYIMPQIAARVTASSRVLLYQALMSVERPGLFRGKAAHALRGKPGQAHYCDTDSAICDVPLRTGTALGELKDEYPEFSGQLSGHFIGPKMYRLWSPTDSSGGRELDMVRAKGLSGKPDERRRLLEQLLAGETIHTKRLEKVGTLAREGFMRGPRIVEVPKRLLQNGGKRRILDDGSTEPYWVEMSK